MEVIKTAYSWESETQKLLAEIQSDIKEITRQQEELQAEKDSLTHEAQAMTTALEVHLRRTSRHEPVRQDARSRQ
jgi:Skp family chaperone for outer membrane proteins